MAATLDNGGTRPAADCYFILFDSLFLNNRLIRFFFPSVSLFSSFQRQLTVGGAGVLAVLRY